MKKGKNKENIERKKKMRIVKERTKNLREMNKVKKKEQMKMTLLHLQS